MRRQPWTCVATLVATAFLLSTTSAFAKSLAPDPVPTAWLRAHADSANGGFANVVTGPAAKVLLTMPLGTIAYGAGPVIGQDGTVYIGNRQGTLLAFRADGSKAWSRQLPPGQEILASPAVGADGSIYVIGVSMFTDNRVTPPFTRPDSMLHKFLPGGGYAWNVPFPETGTPISNGRGATSAPPNIWSFGGTEVVMVPVSYPNRIALGREVRLVAFSTDGPGVLAETTVTYFGQTVSGSGCFQERLLCLFPGMGFEGQGSDSSRPEDRLPSDAQTPMPGVAISTPPGGGTPLIVVSDQVNDIVGFTFSPQGGFVEGFRAHDTATRFIATPLALADTKTFVGAREGVVVFRGQDVGNRSLIQGMGGTYLTRLVDGQTLIATGYGGFGEFRGNEVVHRENLPGQSMVAAAASRSHVFISTASAFYTYDTVTMTQSAKVDWRAGGVSPPAIGPRGDVYAVANNMLYVFPRPCDSCANQPLSGTMPLAPVTEAAPGTSQPIAPPPAPTQPAQGSDRFEKPTGPTGLRLYACTTLDGNDCGRPVADAFCRGQGWDEADKYDTDSKKTQAETLAGEVCTKNKCKIFDYIECEN